MKELADLLPDRLATGEAVRAHHANTLTVVQPQIPDAVAWPETAEETAAIVRLAARYETPIIAFGAGTSLEGHVNAPHGGVAVDFTRMNRVLAVRPDDMDCTVEAGVTRHQLAAELRATGMFFPVDPGADHATLGGMAATRASGTTTVRYGSMRDNVVSVTAVMASGEIVRTARRARKSAAGYDLTRLLVGSEGTLGLITDVTLKLYGAPEQILGAVAIFETIEAACRAATAAIQSGLGLARIELLDAAQIRCVNARSRLGLAEAPTLFLEFHGSPAACRDDFATFEALAADEGGRGVQASADEAGRRQLWKARHDAFWAVKTSWPGKQTLVTDIAVPLSNLAAAVSETAADIAASGLTAPLVGHVGDGNFHAIVVLDASDLDERRIVDAFLDRLAARALAFDGTVTGEHGVGEGKARFLAAEHGAGVEVMRQIKRALDPLNILNPGKIFPV
ncbi:MAG: FAD-binding oxidoreductase [Hyphomicrobium sp.]